MVLPFNTLFLRDRRPGLIVSFVALGLIALWSPGFPVQAQGEPAPVAVRTDAADISAMLDALDRHLDYIPTQVVVKFKAGVGPAGQERALSAMRNRPAAGALRWLGPVAIATDLGQPDARVLAAQMRAQPEVEYAEPNYLYHSTATPNDPGFSLRQWNMTALDMPRAWDINPGATSDIIVAVIDSGITTVNAQLVFRTWNGGFVNAVVPVASNPDLPVSRLVFPADLVLTGSSTTPGTSVLDFGGHGTHVSGTIGEEANNGIAEVGLAYKARIMPIKALGCYWDRQFLMSASNIPGFHVPFANSCTGSQANIAFGIRYAADNGAKVINLSLGGPGEATTIRDAINYAVSKGVFVAIAAGNNFDTGNPVDYPAKYAETIAGAMAVGAVGRSLRHAYYSNSGSYVEIAAPGGDDIAGGAAGDVWQSTIFDGDSDATVVTFPRFDRYVEKNLHGTSMAAPHVAGAAALIMSQLGAAATPAVVEQMLKATARVCDAASCDPAAPRVGALGRNDLFGAGLLQPRAALFGFGLRK